MSPHSTEKRCNTPLIADLILKGEISQIKEAMESSSAAGMQTFDSTLERLYREGLIGLEEALSNSDSRTNLEAAINFG
jgi:twitching motility protein PilU